MTDDMMRLRTLLEKSSDAGLLREMIGFTAQRLMELEVTGLAGAEHGERSAGRVSYRDRDWETERGPSSCASRSCAGGATSRPSWSRGAWPRRR
jgi:hypothetical protein